jgi:hypothetical protein
MLLKSVEGIDAHARRLEALEFEFVHDLAHDAQIIIDDQNVCFGPHARTSSVSFCPHRE